MIMLMWKSFQPSAAHNLLGQAIGEARCNRGANLVSVGDGFSATGGSASGGEKTRQSAASADKAWAECGGGARSIGLHSMQAREPRRRPKIADVFFEPNSPHYQEALTTWVAGMTRFGGGKA